METRVAKLEAVTESIARDIAEIKQTLRGRDGLRDRMERDFRLLLGAIVAAGLILAGLLAKGFGWL